MMRRRPVDMLSVAGGLIVVVLGLAALGGGLGRLLNEPAQAWPALLAVVALLLVVSTFGGRRNDPNGGGSGRA